MNQENDLAAPDLTVPDPNSPDPNPPDLIAPARRPYGTGDAQLDARLRELVAEVGAADPRLTFEMLATAMRMAGDHVSRLDRKLITVALKEMRYAFKVFAEYRHRRKVTIFGSARVRDGDPEYETAREFGRLMADRDWMVVTGAGPGIMRAGNHGAGMEKSFGVNIVLPFENQPNEYIATDPKLINFKYFFTRKLMFIKEADAFVLFPGGFGTMDELYELLTLIQTGKSDIHPIVMLEAPGGAYWSGFDQDLRQRLLEPGYIDANDLSLFYLASNPAEAVTHIETFFSTYHSQRYVGDLLILRLHREPSPAIIDSLNAEFADILRGRIEATQASRGEVEDADVPDLPRLAVPFDRVHYGRLRQLMDRINQLVEVPGPNSV